MVVSNILYFHLEICGRFPFRRIFFRWVETTTWILTRVPNNLKYFRTRLEATHFFHWDNYFCCPCCWEKKSSPPGPVALRNRVLKCSWMWVWPPWNLLRSYWPWLVRRRVWPYTSRHMPIEMTRPSRWIGWMDGWGIHVVNFRWWGISGG